MITALLQNNPLNVLALIASLAPEQVAGRLSALGINVAPDPDAIYDELVKIAKKNDKNSLQFILQGLKIPADEINEETKSFLITNLGAEEKHYITKEADTETDNNSGENNNDSTNNDNNNNNNWLELGIGVTGFLTSLFSFLNAKNNTQNQTTNNTNNNESEKKTNWFLIAGVISGVILIALILIFVLKK
jgi:hypothetical protein